MKKAWNVTFEIVTEESAEIGDAESRGFIIEGATLREALAAFSFCGVAEYASAISADSSHISVSNPPRWFDSETSQNFETGENETRALHIPEGVTPASSMRLARLLGVIG